MIRNVKLEDATQIADIYNYYIKHTVVTFEEELVSGEEFEKRILEVTKKGPWLVYEIEGDVVGYAYGREWKARASYQFSVESTIYLKYGVTGKGIGKKLYTELLNQLKQLNFHVVIGGASLPNSASVALHEKLGFKKVAHFKEVGRKFDTWIDVGYWVAVLIRYY